MTLVERGRSNNNKKGMNKRTKKYTQQTSSTPTKLIESQSDTSRSLETNYEDILLTPDSILTWQPSSLLSKDDKSSNVQNSLPKNSIIEKTSMKQSAEPKRTMDILELLARKDNLLKIAQVVKGSATNSIIESSSPVVAPIEDRDLTPTRISPRRVSPQRGPPSAPSSTATPTKAERFAGAAFSNSPAPSTLPIPSFAFGQGLPQAPKKEGGEELDERREATAVKSKGNGRAKSQPKQRWNDRSPPKAQSNNKRTPKRSLSKSHSYVQTKDAPVPSSPNPQLDLLSNHLKQMLKIQ